MKKVLIITYFFPPRPDIGAQRMKGLAKYLPEFGWEPVILTATLPGPPPPYARVVQVKYERPDKYSQAMKQSLGITDESIVRQQNPTARIWKQLQLKSFEFGKRLLAEYYYIPDRYKGWYKPAVKAGTKLLQSEKFNVILSSSSPVTAHLIAADLKRQSNIPWLADFRDLWTQNHDYRFGLLRRQIEEAIERKTIAAANSLTCVSDPLVNQLMEFHRHQKINCITNGFDPEERMQAPPAKRFTITYTGQLYKTNQDPTLFCATLSDLLKDGTLDLDDLDVRFYGPPSIHLEELIRAYRLEGIVHQSGFIKRDQMLERQRESHLLLLFDWQDKANRGIYTGKIFDYLAAGRPILATGSHRGVVSELLEKTQAGSFITKAEQLKTALVEFYGQYKEYGTVPYRGFQKEIDRFDHRTMAGKFAGLMDDFLPRSGSIENV